MAAQSAKLRPTIACAQRHVEIDAQRRRRVAPRARGERLGVEHQPVHVEDHRGGAADGRGASARRPPEARAPPRAAADAAQRGGRSSDERPRRTR